MTQRLKSLALPTELRGIKPHIKEGRMMCGKEGVGFEPVTLTTTRLANERNRPGSYPQKEIGVSIFAYYRIFKDVNP